jgi:hypothetical protein
LSRRAEDHAAGAPKVLTQTPSTTAVLAVDPGPKGNVYWTVEAPNPKDGFFIVSIAK